MDTPRPALPPDRVLLLTRWLRRQLWAEAGFNLFQGILFGSIGLVVGGAVTAVILLVIAAGHGRSSINFVVAGAVFLAVLAVSLRGAYKTRWGLDYPRGRPSRHTAVSVNSLHAFFNVVCELFYAAPGLYLNSLDSLGKTFRLLQVLRRDLLPTAQLLLWLFDRGRKSTVEEIKAALLGAEAIRVLPLLRDVPGVIWLTYRHGVVILSQELRFQMGTALGQMPPPPSFHEPEPPPHEENSFADRPQYSGDAEEVAWYVTLGLPPYASLSTVKRRYRQLVKIHHPDAGRAVSDEQFKRINAAYHNILKFSTHRGA